MKKKATKDSVGGGGGDGECKYATSVFYYDYIIITTCFQLKLYSTRMD